MIIILIRRTVISYSSVNKIICLFIAITFVRNVISYITMELGIYNMFLYNWHNIISSAIFGILYFSLLHNYYFKVLSVISIVLSIVASLLDYKTLINISTTQFNNFSYNIFGCFAVVLILCFLFELIQSLKIPKLTEYSPFWFSAGALIYYSGTVFSYLFVNYTLNNQDLAIVRRYWMIDAILFIVFCFFQSFSIWYMKPAKTV